ncbi:MAG: PRC-barrel domain-containing protein [Nitrososphaerales archaeon]|nr:PRC-barrel domain-containing protein [Nitrososphaerales archaeon]
MEKKSITKEKVVGMQVINGEGSLIGTVKDVSFAIGEAKMFMVVEMKDGRTQEFPWEDIQAASDFVLLKPKPKIEAITPTPASVASTQTLCPACGKPLTYYPEHKRWYCHNEKKWL